MSGSVNRATILGHLGRDPETRRFESGGSIVTFSVATSERWTDKRTSEKVEKTEWHQVVITNEHLQKIADQYLKKGSRVYLEGQLRTRKWSDNAGVDRYTTEIVVGPFVGALTLLDRADRDGSGGSAPAAGSPAPASTPRPSRREELDDEIPF